MAEWLRDKIVISRKEHNDEAHFYIDPYRNGLTFTELRAYAKARKNGFKIKKGDPMVRTTCVDCGKIFDFKAIPELDEICIKHNFYEE